MKDKTKQVIKDSLITIFFMIAATLIGIFFQHCGLHDSNIVIIYIFSALLIARFTDGYVYGIVCTICSVFLFNFFFTEPIMTLKVNDPTYLITFVIMSVIAVMTSTLTAQVKEGEHEAKEKEAATNALYKMTNLLVKAKDMQGIAAVTVNTIHEVMKCHAAILVYDEEEEVDQCIFFQGDYEHFEDMKVSKSEMADKFIRAGKDFVEDGKYYSYKITDKSNFLAVLQIPIVKADAFPDAKLRLLYSMIESSSLAFERMISLHDQVKSKEQTEQERYRGNLLRAISHDLRTPLAGIMGSGEMLMSYLKKDDPCYQIAENIYTDADWLHSLVENILNLTKLQNGHLNLNKNMEVLEEVLSAAVMMIEKRFPDRNIEIDMPDEVIFLQMDATLMTQVLVNLLDNAVKHTPKSEEIGIRVEKDEKEVRISVYDHGCGINEKDLKNVFEMFYTTRGKSADASRGIGLGLTICQSIVQAHGGTIRARNRAEGGAEFTIIFPEVTHNDQSRN